MKVFKFWHSSNSYKTINLEDTLLLEKIVDGFYNEGHAYGCEFGKFNWAEDDLQACDLPMINGSIPVLSQKAFEVVSPFLLPEEVEVLPIEIDCNRYYILHLLKVYHVLNEKSSVIKYFRNGDIKTIDKYVFLPKVSETPQIFQISELQMFVFVKEGLHDAIVKAGITGADFEECRIKDYNFLEKIMHK